MNVNYKACRFSSFLLILLSGLLSGCANDKLAPVPSYIQVDSFSFQGNGPDSTGYPTQRISDVWIYVNNQIIGTYAIPTGRIPVLAEGNARISIQAGVYTDGIRKSRVYYPFYQSWDLDTILEKEKTMKLRPHFTFMPVWKGKSLKKPFTFFQDFEWSDSGCVKGDNGNATPFREFHNGSADEALFGKRYLKLTTIGDLDVLDLSNNVYVPLETNGNPVYLEFDYKSTCQVQVGVRGKVGTSATGTAEDLILNPTETWTKIYVSLSDETGRFHTEALSQRKPAYFRFFIRTLPPPGAGNSFCIDNIRLLN
jgi:hypothetical protein